MHTPKIEILLIDDDLASAALITAMLSEGERNFSVRHVRHPEEGLSFLRDRTFDIALVGIGNGRGLEAALAVRARSQSMPIIVMAPHYDEEVVQKAWQSDIQDYLVKCEITGGPLKRSIRHAILRKSIVEAQWQCEQWFASFMLHLPAAAWTKDPMGRYVYGNKEHERVFSMPLSEYSGKRDEEFLPPETARQLRENDARVLTEGESLQTIEALLKADGIQHHFMVNKFPIPGPDGRPAYVAGIGLDITERVRAEEALQKSERKFAKVFHAAPALIAVSTLKDGTIIDINETALHVLGYQRHEVIGRTGRDINFWVDDSDRSQALQKLAEQGSVRNFEVRFRGKNGQIFAGLVSAEIVDIDGDRCMLVMIRDITDRKQAEEALRKSERKLSTIFHAAPALIVISTLQEGRMIDINETALQALGYQRDEVIGRTGHDINFWVDASDQATLQQRLAERGSIRNFELRFRGKNRQIFAGLFSGEVIDIDGDRCMLTLIKDITARKQAEEEIERLNTELAVRAADLEEANRELEAFNYTVAHDLRKPLTSINGYCQFIQDACGDILDDTCKKYLQEAFDGTWRMNRLIDTLLTFSNATRREPRRESVDLSSLVQEVADELQHAEPGRRGTFQIAEEIKATGDSGLLRVVLANLLGNAWKYAGMREKAVIEFGETDIGGERAFFVRDNGPGFAMADAGQLFVPFQRLPGAEAQAGFGIGLATVERIIRRHGGHVWAEGEPGKGATFYFTLRPDA